MAALKNIKTSKPGLTPHRHAFGPPRQRIMLKHGPAAAAGHHVGDFPHRCLRHLPKKCQKPSERNAKKICVWPSAVRPLNARCHPHFSAALHGGRQPATSKTYIRKTGTGTKAKTSRRILKCRSSPRVRQSPPRSCLFQPVLPWSTSLEVTKHVAQNINNPLHWRYWFL